MTASASATQAAEQSVLGALLLDNRARARLNGLHVEHFEAEPHRLIFAAIVDELDDSGAADAVAVFERLARSGTAERAGGLPYLNALAANAPSAANASRYAEAVERAARMRQAAAALRDALDLATRGDEAGTAAAIERASKATQPNAAAELPRLLDMRGLATTEPAAPAFIVRDWLPAGEVALFAGHGGTGKSAIALYLCVCIALGVPFFGLHCERRRVLLLSLEDTEPVLHWRIRRVCAWLGVDAAGLAGWLTIADGTDCAAELYAEHRDGAGLTRAYEWLREKVAETGAELLVIDGASDAFGANEINRRHVRQFVRAVRRLVPRSGAAVILAHVDKATAKSGDTSQGYSGSTAWSNSVRARWYLRPDGNSGDLLLELQKANLAPAGAQVRVRWLPDAHVFAGEPTAPAGGLERDLAEADDRARLVQIIREADPPIPAAVTGPRTAYTAMQARGLPDAHQRDKRRFWRDLEALRAAGKVLDIEHRTPDRKRRLVLGVA